jgi:hypothetical protein
VAEIARSYEMEIMSCAEESYLRSFGIHPGKYIDDQMIGRVFGIDVSHIKDPSQRSGCGCVLSKDIGMYDTCLFGCRYCCATTSFARAWANHVRHDPEAPSIFS